MKKIFINLSLIFLSLFFLACSDSSSSSSTENTGTPVLYDFLANIDENQTIAQTLGKIEVESIGGDSISSFRLEGSGYSNFDISSTGVISTKNGSDLNCISKKIYDLDVIASNKYGDSNKAEALIQVNCGDEPVLQRYILSFDYQTGIVGTMNFVRTASGSNNPATDIKGIELVNPPSSISIIGNSVDGSVGDIFINGSLEEARYDIKVRAINNDNIIGPYVYLTIYNGSYGDTVDTDSDDWPDYLDQSVNTAVSVSPGGSYSIGANMNHMSDHDYIKIYVDSDMDVSFSLSTDGVYNYGNGGNYIALYDEFGTYLNTYSDTFPSMYLTAGYYYVNVHETSDFYTLNIYTSGGSADSVGDDIYNTSYLGSVDSVTPQYYNSSIDYLGDRDVFEFYVADTNGTVSITTSSSDFDTYGRLYDGVGNLIFENDDGTDTNFFMSPYLMNGTYYIEVSGLNDSEQGYYTLDISLSP